MTEKEASFGYFQRKDRPQYDYLGFTDGTIYYAGLVEFQKIFKEQGKEKAQEFLRELYLKESEGAEPRVIPRNFLYTNEGGAPINQMGEIIPFNPYGYGRKTNNESPQQDTKEGQQKVSQ